MLDHQENLKALHDPGAKTGHKTADSSFFGYKTHLAMCEERIITAAAVTTGEKSEGRYLQTLTEKTERTGMKFDTIIGDTAYSDRIIFNLPT
ncbi:hypothetical protein J6TS2_22150 [Heyndrickxia sporothermodurans]|nr:hypothetical protein J6TS2_22150 [Heyndrickxia sporothermodurans]